MTADASSPRIAQIEKLVEVLRVMARSSVFDTSGHAWGAASGIDDAARKILETITQLQQEKNDDTACIESRDEDIQSWMAALAKADARCAALAVEREQLAREVKIAMRPWIDRAISRPGTVTYADWEKAMDQIFGPIEVIDK